MYKLGICCLTLIGLVVILIQIYIVVIDAIMNYKKLSRESL